MDPATKDLYPDALDQRTKPDRALFSTGMLVVPDTLQDDQTYHRGQLARALAYLHGNGTVAGLKVAWKKAVPPDPAPGGSPGTPELLQVGPGLAVDRIGRLIEVPVLQCLRLGIWYDQQGKNDPDGLRKALHGPPANGVVVDLFLRFVVCPQRKTPVFASGPFDSLGAVAPSRLHDCFALDLVPRMEPAPGVPHDPWKDLAAVADPVQRRQQLRDRLAGSWHEAESDWGPDGPKPGPEHPDGQDPTSVFLARIVLPATDASPPARGAADVTVNDGDRLFVYPTAALAGWLGV
jgi:hypothetical protein